MFKARAKFFIEDGLSLTWSVFVKNCIRHCGKSVYLAGVDGILNYIIPFETCC